MNVDNLFEYLVDHHHWTNETDFPYNLLCLLYPDKILSPNDKSDLEILAENFDNRRLLIKEDWLEEEIELETKDLGDLNRKMKEVKILVAVWAIVGLILLAVAAMFLPVETPKKTRIVTVLALTATVVFLLLIATKKDMDDKKELRAKVLKDSSAIEHLNKHVGMMDQCARETRRFINEHSKKADLKPEKT